MNLTKFDEIKTVPPIQEQLRQGLKTIAMSNYSNPLEAAMEIIDNSIDERDPKNTPLLLDITVKKNKITFFDSHSLGMGHKELSDFLTWGYSPKRNQKGKIGRYGAGGKGAIGYLGVSCEIRTKRKDEEVVWELKESNWRDENLKTFIPIHTKNIYPMNVGFTQIDINKVDKKINAQELIRMLGQIYKPLLESKLITVRVNKFRIDPFAFDLDDKEPKQQFTEQTRYGKISGWFSKQNRGSGLRGGIRCYYNGRLITRDYKKIHEFFGHPDPQYMGSMNYLVGELYLDFVPVLPNKTDFNRGSNEWIVVERIMYEKLVEITNQLKNKKEEVEITEEDLRNLPEAENLVRLAFTNYEKHSPGGSNPINGIDHGRKSPQKKDSDQTENDNQEQIIVSQEEPMRTPKTPPPSSAVGSLIRKHGFPKFDVLEGDGLSRGNLIEVDGTKKVVIYKAFPEYLIRGPKDVLYKAEVAIMQLAKPEAEEEIMSPDQYLGEIDGLMREVIRLYNAKRKGNAVLELEDIIQ